MSHLWEHEHSYYCEENNWFNRDCHQVYSSWAEFVAGDPYGDPDFNLLFRWDWTTYSDEGHRLCLYWMLQRKGRYQSDTIAVTPDDEPAIRAWLEPRWHHMRSLWSPLSEVVQ